jgi:hypothetical protein
LLGGQVCTPFEGRVEKENNYKMERMDEQERNIEDKVVHVLMLPQD